jgi:hypothetical protein
MKGCGLSLDGSRVISRNGKVEMRCVHVEFEAHRGESVHVGGDAALGLVAPSLFGLERYS